MSRSKVDQKRLSTLADWLVDSYGIDGDIADDFIQDARDLKSFLRARGWQIAPCPPPVK